MLLKLNLQLKFCSNLVIWQLGDEAVCLLLQLFPSWQVVQFLLQLTLDLDKVLLSIFHNAAHRHGHVKKVT